MLKTAVAIAALVLMTGGDVVAQSKGAAAPSATPNWRAPPRYTTLNLRSNFEPDPTEVAVEAGGDGEATGIGPDCSGWIDFSKPDVDLNYTAGEFPLYISVVAGVDTTLIINDPAGNWLCNDDMEGVNPGIVIQRPASGNYNFWIGTFDQGRPQRATLRVSEIPPQR